MCARALTRSFAYACHPRMYFLLNRRKKNGREKYKRLNNLFTLSRFRLFSVIFRDFSRSANEKRGTTEKKVRARYTSFDESKKKTITSGRRREMCLNVFEYFHFGISDTIVFIWQWYIGKETLPYVTQVEILKTFGHLTAEINVCKFVSCFIWFF